MQIVLHFGVSQIQNELSRYGPQYRRIVSQCFVRIQGYIQGISFYFP